MRYCFHYQFDKEANKYVSLAIRYVGNRNPNKVHKYRCKRCGLLLHTLDVQNLENKIKDLNMELHGDDLIPFRVDVTDIHDMLKPVPDAYHEDSKYRDNQIR